MLNLQIHICWKVEREAKMEPPIQTEYLRSGGAMILTFIEEGARAVISFCIRSEIPGYIVVPPDWANVSEFTHPEDHTATYHDNVAVEILANINVALHDGVEGGDVDTTRFESKDGWLEEGLGGSESLIADCDDLTVRKFIGLFQAGTLRSGLDFLLEVKCHVAELLLDVSDNFSLGSGGESVASLSQDLHEIVGQVAAGHVDTREGMRKSE